MAQHGYLREYDEAPDRGDDRERSDRDWHERDRDRRSERDRNFMFEDRDRNRSQNRDRDDNRGFFSRMEDDARSWFGDDDRQDRGAWENNRDWPQRSRGSSGGYGRQSGFGGSNEWREGSRSSSSSSHPDDHYRSWRDKQMQALDRDYEDYCREREQQFHRDFDSWRQNRQQQPQASSSSQQPQSAGGQQRSTETEESELVLENTRAETPGAGNTPSPMGEATLGTSNSENTSGARARR
jgi:hypothetical protein